MAEPLSADQLLTALRNEGLRVVEYRDWRTHNRNHVGPWAPVHGVMVHHTVTSGTESSVELCYNGYSQLPGPLCHGVIAKDGTVYLVGNGRANHAGLGDDDVLRAVIAESALPPDDEANTDGNRHFYGFECINLGDGQDPWPAAQLEAIEQAAAAICRAHGWTHRSVIGHLEWQPGKVDPRGFTMASMRERIAVRLASAPPSEEDDMPDNWNLASAADMTLSPGHWTTVPVGSADLLTSAVRYTGAMHLTLTAPAGGTVQGRFYHLRPDGTRWTGPIVERLTTSGSSFLDFPHAGSVAADEKVRFEAVYFPASSTDSASASITSSWIRGLSWS
ncbi:peptidoglycan recognition family protein [Streptomyces sp. NPDC049597]|uniref:peptidoglycan recognition protein family protein n=1 Tax=Streptomyces sp. NPDC049597 TaxID=3155276 RepID=UPI003446E957